MAKLKPVTPQTKADHTYQNDVMIPSVNELYDISSSLDDKKIDKGIIKLISGKLSGNTVTIQFGSGWAGAVATFAFVKHPTGGHWVSLGAVSAITMNPQRTQVSITVDGYYGNQDVICSIMKVGV